MASKLVLAALAVCAVAAGARAQGDFVQSLEEDGGC